MGFNPQTDLLYSLGDLVNRGQESANVLEWLKKPWFRAIQGNHESIIVKAWQQPDDSKNLSLLRSVGGDWWFGLGAAQQELVANGLASLPYCRTVHLLGQQIGLVHADVPEGVTWADFSEALIARTDGAVETALWSRWRWSAGIRQGLGEDFILPVTGVDWVFVGHSPVERPTVVGNVVFTDCGLWRGNSNGIICLDDWLQAQNQP